MPDFVVCAHCSRYIRSDESACPFCSAAIPTTLEAAPAHVPTGLSRAAAFALRAALAAGAAAAVACSGDDGSQDISRTSVPGAGAAGTGGDEATATGGAGGGTTIAAGGSGGTATASGGALNLGGGGAGGPAAGGGDPDAGQLADAGSETDANDDAGFVPIPIYGGPFPDDRRAII